MRSRCVFPKLPQIILGSSTPTRPLCQRSEFPQSSKFFFLWEHVYGVAAAVSATTETIGCHAKQRSGVAHLMSSLFFCYCAAPSKRN